MSGALAAINGINAGISNGVSLYSALENKRRYEREFETQQKQRRQAQQNWQATFDLNEAKVDQAQQNWESEQKRLKDDAQYNRDAARAENLYKSFRERVQPRLHEFANDPNALADFLNESADDFTLFSKFGYMTNPVDHKYNEENGLEFYGFVPSEDGNGVMVAMKTPDGEIVPYDEARSKDGPPAVFTTDDIMSAMAGPQWGHYKRTRDVGRTLLNEYRQQLGSETQDIEAALAEQDRIIQKLQAEGRPPTEEEQLALDAADATVNKGAERTGMANDWASETPGPKRPESLSLARPSTPAGNQQAGNQQAGNQQAGNQQAGDQPWWQGMSATHGGYDDTEDAEAAGRGGWGPTLESPGQVLRDREASRTEAIEQQADRSEQQREASLADAISRRDGLSRKLKSTRQSLTSLNGKSWYNIAAKHGIDVTSEEGAQSLSRAIRYGDPEMTAQDANKAAQKAQEEALKAQREHVKELGTLADDAIDNMPDSIKESDYFSPGEFKAAILTVLSDLSPGDAPYANQAMILRATANARDSTQVATNLYAMAHGVDPDQLYEAVEGYADAYQSQPTPDTVKAIGEHLANGGKMSDFRP